VAMGGAPQTAYICLSNPDLLLLFSHPTLRVNSTRRLDVVEGHVRIAGFYATPVQEGGLAPPQRQFRRSSNRAGQSFEPTCTCGLNSTRRTTGPIQAACMDSIPISIQTRYSRKFTAAATRSKILSAVNSIRPISTRRRRFVRRHF
jgi:hypothetical protein